MGKFIKGLGSLEKKINPLSKYDPLSASSLTGQNKTPSTPAAAVPPPVAVSSIGSPDIEAARRAALARSKNRKGFASSIRAGNTNSGTSYSNSTGQRSLLGI